MRRALLLLFAVTFLLIAPRADAATKNIEIKAGGNTSPGDLTINGGDSVKWTNTDDSPHTVFLEGGAVPPGELEKGESTALQQFPDPGDSDAFVDYHIDAVDGPGGTITVKAKPAETTTTTKATTTTKPTTTTSSTTTSTSTTSTSTTSTTLVSSASGTIPINNAGGGGGSSSLPLILGALVVVAGLAGLAYWLWLRSGEPYDDDGPDWTQEPPPTTQGPQI